MPAGNRRNSSYGGFSAQRYIKKLYLQSFWCCFLFIKLCETVDNYRVLLYKNREKECNFAAEIGKK